MKALRMLLRRANEIALDSETMRTIDKIKEGCEICLQIAASPGRFKLTVESQDLNITIVYKLTPCLSVDG